MNHRSNYIYICFYCVANVFCSCHLYGRLLQPPRKRFPRVLRLSSLNRKPWSFMVWNICFFGTYCWWFRNPAIITWDVWKKPVNSGLNSGINDKLSTNWLAGFLPSTVLHPRKFNGWFTWKWWFPKRIWFFPGVDFQVNHVKLQGCRMIVGLKRNETPVMLQQLCRIGPEIDRNDTWSFWSSFSSDLGRCRSEVVTCSGNTFQVFA